MYCVAEHREATHSPSHLALARHFLIHLASCPWQTPSSGTEQWSIKVSEQSVFVMVAV